MKSFLSLLCVVLLMACNSDDATLSGSIVGTWQLREVLSDPGDGSGQYEPVRSDKTIQFFADGTFETNVSFCNGTQESGEGFSGTYNPDNGIILPEGCVFTGSQPRYELQGKVLIIFPACFEPCGEKYSKVSD